MLYLKDTCTECTILSLLYRNQRMSSNSTQVAFTGLSNNDQNQDANHEVLRNNLYATTFED